MLTINKSYCRYAVPLNLFFGRFFKVRFKKCEHIGEFGPRKLQGKLEQATTVSDKMLLLLLSCHCNKEENH